MESRKLLAIYGLSVAVAMLLSAYGGTFEVGIEQPIDATLTQVVAFTKSFEVVADRHP